MHLLLKFWESNIDEFKHLHLSLLDRLLEDSRGVLLLWLDHFNLVNLKRDEGEGYHVVSWHHEDSVNVFQ